MYSSIWNLVAFLVFTIIPRILAAPTDINHATILSREDQIQESYDYIIVGGGTAGLTIADRLTEDGRYTVLVIEYGYLTSQSIIVAGNGRDFNDPGIRYNITSTKQPGMNNKTQAVVIGCCVGGSSAINGMIVIRGTRTEYDGWKELGSEGSSWDWDGVIPYFRKALHFNPPSPELAQSFNITWDPSGWGKGIIL
ncbi:FAD/NAD(P)-binding protein [Glarea lozoyensis ATCC 20868]|uniref:FAD/NAD(P)-binding protein n=1 Tax=Glarea lozoyensis (strain ATCC 20868 / MF5171) TaxID=1116229 RepID=S3DG53_GLAL2|nr:FAD/NAD(P)-binding protein [Glarea lozoyensis ATCC 20868]EPE25603.1 FAD/NAD(P)-binding protein [Glarea lozoyensis ATCC 20868]